jgi:hypothetical protein
LRWNDCFRINALRLVRQRMSLKIAVYFSNLGFKDRVIITLIGHKMRK